MPKLNFKYHIERVPGFFFTSYQIVNKETGHVFWDGHSPAIAQAVYDAMQQGYRDGFNEATKGSNEQRN